MTISSTTISGNTAVRLSIADFPRRGRSHSPFAGHLFDLFLPRRRLPAGVVVCFLMFSPRSVCFHSASTCGSSCTLKSNLGPGFLALAAN